MVYIVQYKSHLYFQSRPGGSAGRCVHFSSQRAVGMYTTTLYQALLRIRIKKIIRPQIEDF